MVHSTGTRSPRRPSADKGPSICNPVRLFGAGLLFAQLIVFYIGINGSHEEAGVPESLPMIPAAVPVALPRRVSPRKRKTNDPDPDGAFNGYPVYFKSQKGVVSSAHCVGENYQPDKSWMERSCKFSFFCFDVDSRQYVVFQDPEEEQIYEHTKERPYLDVSQSYLQFTANKSNTVSIGGINQKWTYKSTGIPRLEWFPQIRKAALNNTLSFYELPHQVVLAPFHSLNGGNPGHLLWDDFLPVYTLLAMFGLDGFAELLLMRYVLKDGRGLWASCDFRDDRKEACQHMHKKFLPLMIPEVATDENLPTTESFVFETRPRGDQPKSSLVCAKHGIAGIGGITDHGSRKSHGWEEADYLSTHNHGRGGLLYNFRNYMLNNLGVAPTFHHQPPFRIVFSEQSSDIPARQIDFKRQKDILTKTFYPSYVKIESYVFKTMSIKEQVEVASQTSIFVSGCGGGAVTGTFLPKGGSVLLYFVESGGVKNNKPTGKPARLDWDLFNNLAYVNVHWLPTQSMDSNRDLKAFVDLIQHEIAGLMRENSYDYLYRGY